MRWLRTTTVEPCLILSKQLLRTVPEIAGACGAVTIDAGKGRSKHCYPVTPRRPWRLRRLAARPDLGPTPQGLSPASGPCGVPPPLPNPATIGPAARPGGDACAVRGLGARVGVGLQKHGARGKGGARLRALDSRTRDLLAALDGLSP